MAPRLIRKPWIEFQADPSSGSASAVSCGLVEFALGTDTGGSVRVPASNCGIFGMRPSYGAISVAGVNPLAPTFDTVGVLGRDSDVLSKAMSTLLACDVPSRTEIGTVYLLEEAFAISDPEIREALAGPVERMKHHFPEKVKTISLREIDHKFGDLGLRGWYDTYCRIQWAEIWSCLGAWVTEATPQFGDRVRANFEHVKNMDRKIIADAVCDRRYDFELLRSFLGEDDLLCMPTTPALAPIKGSLGIDRYERKLFSSHTFSDGRSCGRQVAPDHLASGFCGWRPHWPVFACRPRNGCFSPCCGSARGLGMSAVMP